MTKEHQSQIPKQPIVAINVDEEVFCPVYKTFGASGADVRLQLEKEVQIEPFSTKIIPLGFKLDLPLGLEAQIRMRSGYKHPLIIANSPATIDSDYRGILKVKLYNPSNLFVMVKPYERICQIVIAPVYNAVWRTTTEPLTKTNRGENGFNSTGDSME